MICFFLVEIAISSKINKNEISCSQIIEKRYTEYLPFLVTQNRKKKQKNCYSKILNDLFAVLSKDMNECIFEKLMTKEKSHFWGHFKILDPFFSFIFLFSLSAKSEYESHLIKNNKFIGEFGFWQCLHAIK